MGSSTLCRKSGIEKNNRRGLSPYLLNDKTVSYYGFGWRLNKGLKNKIVSHSGSNPGYKTKLFVF